MCEGVEIEPSGSREHILRNRKKWFKNGCKDSDDSDDISQ